MLTAQRDLYIVATSHSRLNRIDIASSAGSHSLSSRPLARPRSFRFWATGGSDPRDGVLALAASPREEGGQWITAVTASSIQRWLVDGQAEQVRWPK